MPTLIVQNTTIILIIYTILAIAEIWSWTPETLMLQAWIHIDIRIFVIQTLMYSPYMPATFFLTLTFLQILNFFLFFLRILKSKH